MPLVDGARSVFERKATEKSEVVKLSHKVRGRGKDVLSAEDIKQSKDRINALRNSLQAKTQISYRSEESFLVKPLKESNDEAEEEKEKCDGSDSESLHDFSLGRNTSIVHNRIASYEIPTQNSSPRLRPNTKPGNAHSRPNIACNEGYQPTEISKGKFRVLKERYQTSVNNLTYEGLGFEGKSENHPQPDQSEDNGRVDSGYARINKELRLKSGGPLAQDEDNLIHKLKSEIDDLENETKIDSPTNVIVGNKDILKLLSNKHLANLNIRVEKGPHFRKEGLTDNKWREGLSSIRSSKFGARSSIRSSKRKRRCRYRANILYSPSEEKGTSDSTLKENESDNDEELRKRLYEDKCTTGNEKDSLVDNSKKKFPEYAKVNKRKNGTVSTTQSDVPPRSMSTSPVERAPVVKKICSSGVRLKKDSEPSVTANPVKKADSFRGSRVTRRNSFLYNTKGKSSKEGVEHESFVKTQAVRLKRKSSKNAKKSEYRVSVTIRPSTVANLANKFNTIILQNQTGNVGQQNDVSLGNVSLLESKIPKYYSSPRASFKRKYRHKAARALKEAKERDESKADVDVNMENNGIDNTIYYSENLSKRKSLNNSLSELNMKDLFDDCDYNKTDEEKVCEKLKTALSSGKFKGETDDSEDDLSSKLPSGGNDESVEVKASDSPEHRYEPQTSNASDPSEKEEALNFEKTDMDVKVIQEETDESKVDISPTINPSSIRDLSEDELKVTCTDATKSEEELSSLSNPEANSAVDTKSNPTDANGDLDAERDHVGNHNQEELTEAINTAICVDNLTYGKAEPLFKPLTNANVPCQQIAPPTTPSEKEDTQIDSKANKSEANTEKDGSQTTSTKRKENKGFDDLYSDCSSVAEDTYSEVSSICSELKGKKSKSEMRIYTSLKAVMKNTVKKTKDKDLERKGRNKLSCKRSPSRERDKWFKRSKSKERPTENSKDKPEDIPPKDKQKEKKGKEGTRLYEKWNFKRLKDKGEERGKNKESDKEEKGKTETKTVRENTPPMNSNEENKFPESLSPENEPQNASETEDSQSELYGKLKIACRSRSRERRIAKKQGAKTKRTSIPEKIPERSESNFGDEKELSETGKDETTPLSTDPVIENSPGPPEPSEKEISIYEPHSPNGIKVIPPPPKTPIPSPPKQFKRFLFKHKPRISSRRDSDKTNDEDSKSSKNSENIYENIYSPDVETLKKNREKLEEEGIRPITSFLWSESAKVANLSRLRASGSETVSSGQTYGDFMTGIVVGELDGRLKDSDDHSVRYDKIGSPVVMKKPSEDLSGEVHNYTEIHNSSGSDSHTVSYDDIGAPSAVSYDEIAAPSSCGYDDVRPPSSQGYDPLKPPSEGYDPVNPPKSDSSQYDDCVGVLMVVKQAPTNPSGYVYDDVSMYNLSQMSHSYEPVCPPDDAIRTQYSVPAIPEGSEKDSEDLKKDETEELDYGSEEGEEYGPHEVFSYKLSRIGVRNSGKGDAGKNPKRDVGSGKSLIGSKSENSTRKQKKSEGTSLSKAGVSKDMWEDMTDSEEEADVPLTLTTKLPLSRRDLRNQRRLPRYRVTKKSWTQGVRDVAARAAHSSRPRAHSHANSLASNLARVNPHSRGKAQITPTKTNLTYGAPEVIACSWRQRRADSDSECQSPGHYEAIYEVINPTDEDAVAHTYSEDLKSESSKVDLKDEVSETLLKEGFQEDFLSHPDDQDFDDSFDSDESDEAYSRLRPLYIEPKSFSMRHEGSSTLPAGSYLDEKYLHRKYNRSYSHQPHSINKIAEAANLGMKRLRRNWSLTKNEVRTGLSRIKKKSTFNMNDVKGSSEDILNDVSSSTGDKGKWSLKSHFKRKSSSSSIHAPSAPSTEEGGQQKDNATFYLTLTIASNGGQDSEEGAEGGAVETSVRERRKSMTPSVSSVATTASCETTTSTKASSAGRPLSTPGTSLYRNSSSGSTSGTLFRPTNPPPAPPTGSVGVSTDPEEDYSSDTSKDKLASRLNQILSSGPIAPPGRRGLRSSEVYSSSEVSPVPLLPPTEDKGHQKHPITSLKGGTPSLRQLFPEGINVPQMRNSVASSSSHGSSEGYIRPGDIASSPPPLPARPSTTSSYPANKRSSTLSLGPNSTLAPIHPLPSPRVADGGDSRSYLDLTYDLGSGQDEPPYVSSHFADEPLYQFYTAKVERAALYQADSSEDDYEVINDGGLSTSTPTLSPRPSAMELVTPTDGRRTLWCELPEVVNSGILNKINSQERKLQEAMFEVITSEASYIKSLDVLVNHFMTCKEFSCKEDPVLSLRDRNVLFSDILPVKKCSELFLGDLEKRWQESFLISGITDIVRTHAESSFNVYVKYCSNQIYQDRKLRHLKENNPRFVEILSRLESSPVCQSLAMQSFLMLPMQRVTRLPLLIDAVFNRLEYGSPQWQECKVALASLQKIVAECNEAARKMERMEEMLLISHQLDFREVKAIPLISASRWLVKKGELTRLTWREGDAKLTFGRKISKHSLYFFLFTDLLVVTKKKSDDQHMVLDYCPRNMVQVLELENADKFPGRILDGHKNLIIMTMLQNHENKTVEMVLSCPLESDRSRWMEAVTPRTSENPDERIYEEWDCPQVQAIHAYASTQPDELTLEVSDVFNVLKKTSDGWYQGERLRDGARGWFPGNHTAEIASAHVRARNLRQRYRLLAISGSIVDELKKEKERFEKEEKKKDRRRTITIKEVL